VSQGANTPAPGNISTIAGNGDREFGSGEGVETFGMVVDGAGNIYIADSHNHRIRKVDPNGVMTTVAGNGVEGFSGDGGPATSASLGEPFDVAIDGAGNLYIADLSNHRIRKVDPNGIISTVAGNGVEGFSGDGGPATSASLWGPKGMAIDSTGNLYIADFNNSRVRKVDTNGIITTVAGNGSNEYSGDGRPATSVGLGWLTDVEVDEAGNLYFADEAADRIRKVDPNGVMTTVAGNGVEGFSGDGGPATSASLYNPSNVAIDGAGNLYIADYRNYRIRKVDPNGIISTVAGNGSYVFSGDGGPATSAGLGTPTAVAIDSVGNLYIGAEYIGADYRIRKVAGVTPPTAQPSGTPAPTATPISTPTATPEPTPDPTAIAFEPPSLNFVWVKGDRRNPASQPVLARNVGKLTYRSDPWISVPSTQWVAGGLQMNISVSPASANLDVGVHEGTVTLTSNGKTIILPVKLTVVSANGTLQVNRNQLNFGGFLGDLIADQGVGLSFTGLNSSNWTASGPPWLTLTPANGSVSATAPTTLTVGINTAAIRAAGQYTGTLTVKDGTTAHEIAVELFQVAPGSPTIQLFGLEVTQGIQNLYNEIPFVAERPVFVRGHVRSLTGQPLQKVTAQLIGTRDGVDLGTLNPINPGGSINIVANPDRAQLNESFLFELPPSWRTGTVTLRLVGQSQPIACVDPAEKSTANGVADDCTVTLTYETIPALPIKYFLYTEQGTVDYTTGRRGSETFTANASHASATSKQLLAGLPIPAVDPQIYGPIMTFPGTRTSAQQSKMMEIMRVEHEKAGQPARHFYGLYARYESASDPKATVQGGPGGVAAVSGFAGFGEYYTFQPMATLNMHEIGHNLGRNHVGCGKPDSPDPDYPYPDQRISDVLSGDGAYFGFNIVTQAIYPPKTKDYMSYCHPSWVSPYTYKAMIERLKIHYNSPAATNSGSGQTGTAPGSLILLVSGSITGTDAGSIDGVVSDNANVEIAAIPSEGASEYSVRLEDANGQTIATYAVTPQVAEGQNQEEFTAYTVAVPRPENLARVLLLHEDQPLAERVASANAPTLTLTAPVGGEIFDSQSLSITWSASDADGDELRFNVDYTVDDGASWRKLVWDWTESALEIDSADLPGSTQARIRVSANDGFHTTFVESETFEIADHAPVAIILSTDLNRYYVGGQSILLEGTGYDLEDGIVSDLTWYSDRDGMLGTGPSLLLDADNLAEGTHLIRLEAKDSTGQSSFGDPTMGVVSEEGFVAAYDTVRFDILYDPLILPAELAVAPNLDFFTIAGATQLLTDTLTVSNLGDGTLDWTASSDSANVTLSSSSGNTPATVEVTVDPTGLAGGLHEGTLTFTPTEATLAPVTVDYFINVYTPTQEVSALPRIQAESGTYAGDAASSDIYGGFDGTGFAAYLLTAGSAVQMTANVASTGTYVLNIRYAAGPHGPEEDRTISLYVNGSKIRQLSFRRTLDWAEWADLITSIDLNAGDNTIEFRVDSGDTGYTNIDYIAVASTSDEPDATDENTGDQADVASETLLDDAEVPTAESDTASDAASPIATCDPTDVPAPTHGGVAVRFVNESGAVAVVSWRDFNGNLVEYHRLDPDSFADQETFETHEWVVQDEAGNVLLAYAASADATQCVLIEQP
jgi:sugar lactone lactonase YvrE